MRKSFTIVALAFTLSAFAVSPALPQNDDQSGPTMGMMGGGCPMMGMMGQGMMGQGMMGQGMMGRGPGMMAGRHAKMAALVEGRLAYLKSELNITDAQSAAWTGYADAVKSRVDVMQGVRETMMTTMQTGTAIERMDARIKNMEAMVEAMKAAKPATEALYAALSDEQKKLADQLIGRDCGAM
jgi:hypothetical protein